ncbi:MULTISPECIES: TetR family transcriptional regulator [unclassified Streptomyces]|uniref:TetR family transcriptional regulator n=1 Tax=unclassified Streptomyces TaxID=2593676 RepID=UPI002DD7B15E|nr:MULTISPECIES: TetR family transcriptional regulator [unclassified Streptomyces]WSF83036.1 TetR family transcriptional regulator [Streptomyces sp. NBC_01744]WSC40704.1 TetR family transcriptional regulator [Streptomyces sp. NBC_01763]WSC48839.1 TetR family transcriptional regulator [Streptomyces sp. NBC_01762]WSC52189.1 TetR family transcriptional regulator [Streptomyces sp. NBC_01761]WSD28492.1 TetR family transcriptional regulator [Streptomyces sp. NBC_01751]
MAAANEPTGSAERTRDAARTRAEILEVATTEFARVGYAGARVDEIAALTRTTKRMIYYYFGSKERLFTAVLERAYAEIRRAESSLDVEHLDPVAATRRLVELTFDHHEAHPDFIRLVSIENIHEAEHIIGSEELGRLGSPATEVLQRILDAGRSSGLFHADADAVDVHAMISSFCFFRVSNRHTFGALFGRDLVAADRREHYRNMLADMIIAYLTAERAEG